MSSIQVQQGAKITPVPFEAGETLLHREDWWVYPVSSLAALAAGYSVFLLEKPAENISETSDVREEKGKDKREKKSHRKREADEQKERHARRRQERS